MIIAPVPEIKAGKSVSISLERTPLNDLNGHTAFVLYIRSAGLLATVLVWTTDASWWSTHPSSSSSVVHTAASCMSPRRVINHLRWEGRERGGVEMVEGSIIRDLSGGLSGRRAWKRNVSLLQP